VAASDPSRWAAAVTRRRVIIRHIVPNAIGVIAVNATFQIVDAMQEVVRATRPPRVTTATS
jgi:hypothetical protein